MKTYIYANSQIIAQHDGAVATDNKYFYLHDRLGSVRQATLGVDQIMHEDSKYFRIIGNVFWEHGKE